MNLRAVFCKRIAVRVLAATTFALVFAICANAQWTVVYLRPGGQGDSYAYGVDGNQQAGKTKVSGVERACMWSGSAATWVNLHPSGGTGLSLAYGVGGGQQVGYHVADNWAHASLWSGSAGTWIDLNPPGASSSYAWGVGGGKQTGYASVGGLHAGVWSGNAASWIDLHPIGALNSYAWATDGIHQVGSAAFGPIHHASLWTGTAASFVDLNPAGVDQGSMCFGVYDNQQVGITRIGAIEHASLWSSTASSWVSLNPSGATNGQAVAISEGEQVGRITFIVDDRASLWHGTAESWTDLDAFLSPNFGNSEATGISQSGGFTYVVGFGLNLTTGRDEAIMWIRQDEFSPTSYTILQGLNFGGNLASLFNSDNDKVYVLCDEFDSNGEIQFDSTLPAGTVNELKFRFEGSASRNDLSQFVRMFNYSTNAYTTVSFQTATIIDSVVEGTITTGVANYYSGSREVKSRVFWIPQADIDASDGWSQSCDQVLWTMN